MQTQQTHSNEALPNSAQPASSNAAKLTGIVRTAFLRLEKFGMNQEEITARNSHLVTELINFPVEVVEKAFTEYARDNSKIPTVSDIRKYVARNMPKTFDNEDRKNVNDYGKLTEHERQNLRDLMARAKQAITSGKCKLISPDMNKPWVYKHWTEYTDHDKTALLSHMQGFMAEEPIKAEGYTKYLKQFCGVPASFFGGVA